MTNIHLEHRYPAPCEQVLNHFWQPQLVEQKYLAQGAKQVRVAVVDNEIRSQRQMQSDVPAMLKSLLGSDISIEQSEQWLETEDGFDCQFQVKLAGVPISIDGVMQWRNYSNGCCNYLNLNIQSSIPILGKTLEAFVGKSCQAMADSEQRYLLEQLHETVDGH
ncbi:DUF2505 domain-containing protein [Ferrimonas senticii]|uniref:DUF2505 domain-containing protein n=1 Tax=Ferrimonas senticii TaxID=394566 RepID=UPI0003F8D47F|nr:DUF2505 domain-containing protein [Ferrimonas senticii]